MQFDSIQQSFAQHWPVWLTTALLIWAAVIDGIQLKVPNWLTFPMIISGWVASGAMFGWEGLAWSIGGSVIGLVLLIPAYAIGGMGAGDVKLLAGVGAWMYIMLDATSTVAVNPAMAMFYAFAISTIIGAVMAVLMVLKRKAWHKHSSQFWMLLDEIKSVGSPTELAERAAVRKPTMLLLPYGIPIAIGTIGYFAWMGMLI
jgi:prepilin peptidase CpaA